MASQHFWSWNIVSSSSISWDRFLVNCDACEDLSVFLIKQLLQLVSVWLIRRIMLDVCDKGYVYFNSINCFGVLSLNVYIFLAIFVSIFNVYEPILVNGSVVDIQFLYFYSNNLAIVAMVSSCSLSFDENFVVVSWRPFFLVFDALCCSGDHFRFTRKTFILSWKFQSGFCYLR